MPTISHSLVTRAESKRPTSERNRPSKADRRAVRINKNLIVNGHLARVTEEYGLQGRDLYLLTKLLGEAQRRYKRTLSFQSRYELLRFLDWPDTPEYYRKLDESLSRWHDVQFEVESWYQPVRLKPVRGMISREASRRRNAKRRRLAREKRGPKTLPRVLTLKLTGDAGIKILFHRVFFHAHDREEGYFVIAWPDEVKQLRRPPEILLYLLLLAFGSKIRINMPDLMTRVALTHRDWPSSQERLEKAVDRISRATGKQHWPAVRPNADGKPIFSVNCEEHLAGRVAVRSSESQEPELRLAR